MPRLGPRVPGPQCKRKTVCEVFARDGVNPFTRRVLKPGSYTSKKIDKYCAAETDDEIPAMYKRKKLQPLCEVTNEDACGIFTDRNKEFNPWTGRHINPNGTTAKRLSKRCDTHDFSSPQRPAAKRRRRAELAAAAAAADAADGAEVEVPLRVNRRRDQMLQGFAQALGGPRARSASIPRFAPAPMVPEPMPMPIPPMRLPLPAVLPPLGDALPPMRLPPLGDALPPLEDALPPIDYVSPRVRGAVGIEAAPRARPSGRSIMRLSNSPLPIRPSGRSIMRLSESPPPTRPASKSKSKSKSRSKGKSAPLVAAIAAAINAAPMARPGARSVLRLSESPPPTRPASKSKSKSRSKGKSPLVTPVGSPRLVLDDGVTGPRLVSGSSSRSRSSSLGMSNREAFQAMMHDADRPASPRVSPVSTPRAAAAFEDAGGMVADASDFQMPFSDQLAPTMDDISMYLANGTPVVSAPSVLLDPAVVDASSAVQSAARDNGVPAAAAGAAAAAVENASLRAAEAQVTVAAAAAEGTAAAASLARDAVSVSQRAAIDAVQTLQEVGLSQRQIQRAMDVVAHPPVVVPAAARSRSSSRRSRSPAAPTPEPFTPAAPAPMAPPAPAAVADIANGEAPRDAVYSKIPGESHIYVAPATLRFMDKGLFTDKAIPKGKIICKYGGRLVPMAQYRAEHPDGDGVYDIRASADWMIDGSDEVDHVGKYANTIRSADMVWAKNAKITVSTNRDTGLPQANLKSTKPIKAGAEIFVAYGATYHFNHSEAEMLAQHPDYAAAWAEYVRKMGHVTKSASKKR